MRLDRGQLRIGSLREVWLKAAFDHDRVRVCDEVEWHWMPIRHDEETPGKRKASLTRPCHRTFSRRKKGGPCRAAFRPPSPESLLLDSQVCEDFRLGFIDSQEVVACRAILGNCCAVFGGMVAVVTTETTWITHMPDVVGMRSPGHLHLRKDILTVECRQFFSGSLDQVRLRCQYLRIAAAIERFKLSRDLCARIGLAGVVGLEQCQPFFVDPWQRRAHSTIRHGPV